MELGQVGAVVGGIGTLLAGVAAVGALMGNEPAPTPVAPPDPTIAAAASSPSVSLTPVSLRSATGFHDLADLIAAFAGQRLDPDDSSNYSFATHVDDSGLLSVTAPNEWSDVELATWLDDNDREIGPAILASTDVDRLYTAWDTAGVFLGASTNEVDPDEMLDAREEIRSENCRAAGRYGFSGDGHEGRYEVWSDCGEGDTVALDLVTNAGAQSTATLLAHIRLTDRADVPALVRILESMSLNLPELNERFRYAPGKMLP